MNPEERKLLERTLELSEENNKMIRKVRGVQKRQALWTYLKILIIFGVAIGAFYYIDPYLEKMINFFNQFSGMKQEVDSSSLMDMLKNIGS